MIPIFLLLILQSSLIHSISIHHQAAKYILKSHNDLRSLVAKFEFKINANLNAEPSSNMRKLMWDAKLAEKAQNYVNENPKEPRNFHGESLYQINYTGIVYGSPHAEAVAAMDEWKAELNGADWSPQSISCEDFKKMRNGLQMIRATSGSVGCAYHKKELHGVLVCMYDGDMAASAIVEGTTHSIYKVGKACSECPSDSKCDEESGLCVGTAESIPEDSSLAKAILTRHNKERSKIANGNSISTTRSCALRSASNMNKLTWDSELAWSAEQYAKKKAHEKRWMSGENIYHEDGSDSNPERIANSAMTSWMNEIMDNSWNLNDKIGEKEYIKMGNGLQMIWATSEKIGCGIYQWTSEGGQKNHASFVCRYNKLSI
ncbi:unnamed protein product [Caenorhabditis angaria]|uniref:SCP domain-containing protein n=1 Tax=Caenorhabditis angaria TaxID=860376 RepID=A0A9P1IMC5_9PELO|nr:unnamed protein product [Caenorhabditis angaria]